MSQQEKLTIYAKNEQGLGDIFVVSPYLTIFELNYLIGQSDLTQNEHYSLHFNGQSLSNKFQTLKQLQITDHTIISIINRPQELQLNNTIPIKVQYEDKTYQIMCKQQDKIKHVKLKIEKLIELSHLKQIIYYQGKQIENQQQLWENGIQPNSILKVIGKKTIHFAKTQSTEKLKISSFQSESNVQKCPSQRKFKDLKIKVTPYHPYDNIDIGPSPLTPQSPEEIYQFQSAFQYHTQKWLGKNILIKDVQSQKDPCSPFPQSPSCNQFPTSFTNYITEIQKHSPTKNRQCNEILLTKSMDMSQFQLINRKELKKYQLTFVNQSNKTYKIIFDQNREFEDIQSMIASFEHVPSQKIQFINSKNLQILKQNFFMDKNMLSQWKTPIMISIIQDA